MIQSIPLSQLVRSPRNVRRTAAPVADLIASIAVHGVLQNLSVEPAGDVFEVVAGGRRLAALQQLAEQGQIAADYPVPCKVTTGVDAHEASLAENVIRQAMHPADEFDAFAKLATEEKLTPAQIAERFGAEEKHVAQRLKLANVAPDLLQDYRDGKATLEQMMALALSDDHEAQRLAWAAGKTQYWKRNPRELREALTEGEIELGSTLGKFVGVEAYEEAGGVMRRDLFGGDRDSYFTDPLLLRGLAERKLQKTADRIASREGWSWVEVRVEFDYSERAKFGRAASEYKGTKETWSAEAKAAAGAVVTIGYNGQADVVRGLVRSGDRKAAAAATGKKVEGGKAAKADKPADALPLAQVQRLQGFRTAVLRAELATQPRIALAALAADLARRALFDSFLYGSSSAGEPIVRIAPDNHFAAEPIREAIDAATRPQLEQLEKDWRARVAPHKSDLFAWLLQEPESTTLELLAYLTAQRIVAADNTEQDKDRGQRFAYLAGVDMADHWQVSEQWLAAQPRAYIAAAVAEVCGKKVAESLPSKKADAARRGAELIVANDPRWLPKPLRAPRVRAGKKLKAEAERAG